MTNRRKVILVGVVLLLSVSSLLAATIFLNPSPEPANVDTTPEVTTPSEQPEKPSEPHEHSDGTDSHGEPLPESTQQAIKQNATQAAEAYVTQPSGEEPAVRSSRLSRFFAPGSPVITAEPPVVSSSYSTSQINLLESSWYDTEKEGVIGVIVYLVVGVNTGFESRSENQTWVVELIQHDGAWLSHTITKSDLPYVQGVN